MMLQRFSVPVTGQEGPSSRRVSRLRSEIGSASVWMIVAMPPPVIASFIYAVFFYRN